MAGSCCAEACTAAVLIGVMHLPGCPFDSAWCLVCEVCQLAVDWVDCRCFLSFVFLGGARRLEISPRNTPYPCHITASRLTLQTQHRNATPGYTELSMLQEQDTCLWL